MKKTIQLLNSVAQMAKVSVFVVILALLLAGFVAINPQKTLASGVYGEVICSSGNVEGVWIVDVSNSYYSGWASGSFNTSNAAAWSKNIPSNDTYQVHFGCGGSPSSWKYVYNVTHNFTGSGHEIIAYPPSPYYNYY